MENTILVKVEINQSMNGHIFEAIKITPKHLRAEKLRQLIHLGLMVEIGLTTKNNMAFIATELQGKPQNLTQDVDTPSSSNNIFQHSDFGDLLKPTI